MVSVLNPETFNSFFIDKVDEIVDSLPKNSDSINFVDNLPMPNCNFSFQYLRVEDVYSAILKLSNSSCLDVYGMNSRILKAASVFISEPLTHIFNCCIDTGIFPNYFKYVKVIPVFKKATNLHTKTIDL